MIAQMFAILIVALILVVGLSLAAAVMFTLFYFMGWISEKVFNFYDGIFG